MGLCIGTFPLNVDLYMMNLTLYFANSTFMGILWKGGLLFCFMFIAMSMRAYITEDTPNSGTVPIQVKATGIVLPEGTPVTLEVTEDIASNKAHKGDIVVLFVLKPVVVNGKTLVNAGRYAEGKVREVKRAGIFGRPGKISFEALNIEAVDGTRVPVKGPMVEYYGRDRRALAWLLSLSLTATGFALLGLLAPKLITVAILLIFVGMPIKGKDITIEAKKIIAVQVQRDVTIQE